MEGGRWLVINIFTGTWGKNLLSVIDLANPKAGVKDLIATVESAYSPVAVVGTQLYLETTNSAPRGRVIAMDLLHPDRAHWKEIIPQREETLNSVQMAGGKLILDYMKDAHSAARIATADGKPAGEVAFPGLGSVTWSSARLADKEIFFRFESYTVPFGVYRFDMESGRSTPVWMAKTSFDSAAYETKQIFYTSKDGTRVPMFLSYRKGMKPDGQNPTLLHGYGGFDVAETPEFDPAIAEWMQMGGVYALANLRGGSEYGDAWHEAGMRAKKQNVFDDFIAAAEWQIANKYTSTPKLAVYGRSNGGLLIGAVLNQRPDLFGAAMPTVGVMDMFRYQKFGFGVTWVGEYGSADNAEDFEVLRKYSPLHNIRSGVKYPPVLVTTADHDDRVMPGHSLKYAATLQQAQAGTAPILIRIETRAGHGAGTPTSKRIDEWADRLTFLHSVLKM
jgi:prolyl oligopeptidase